MTIPPILIDERLGDFEREFSNITFRDGNASSGNEGSSFECRENLPAGEDHRSNGELLDGFFLCICPIPIEVVVVFRRPIHHDDILSCSRDDFLGFGGMVPQFDEFLESQCPDHE